MCEPSLSNTHTNNDEISLNKQNRSTSETQKMVWFEVGRTAMLLNVC